METQLDPQSAGAAPAATLSKVDGTYSPVTVHQQDTIGAIFLGLITLILLIAYFGSERRHLALLKPTAP